MCNRMPGVWHITVSRAVKWVQAQCLYWAQLPTDSGTVGRAGTTQLCTRWARGIVKQVPQSRSSKQGRGCHQTRFYWSYHCRRTSAYCHALGGPLAGGPPAAAAAAGRAWGAGGAIFTVLQAAEVAADSCCCSQAACQRCCCAGSSHSCGGACCQACCHGGCGSCGMAAR